MRDYQERLYRHYISSTPYYITLSQHDLDFLNKFYARNYAAVLPVDRHLPILEVACGTGHFCHFLQASGYAHVTGIDLSSQMVQACHARGLNIVVQAEALKWLAEHPGTYACIVANDFIEHLTKDRVLDFLDAALVALRPGGVLALKTPNAATLFGARDVFEDFTHEVGFTPESLTQVMQATGYTQVRMLAVQPVVGSWHGLARNGLWHLAQVFSRLALAIEGRPLLRPVITSASLIGIGEKSQGESL